MTRADTTCAATSRNGGNGTGISNLGLMGIIKFDLGIRYRTNAITIRRAATWSAHYRITTT